jgi:hypothetical protein
LSESSSRLFTFFHHHDVGIVGGKKKKKKKKEIEIATIHRGLIAVSSRAYQNNQLLSLIAC